VRRRITFAIVGAVIAALVIAGAGTFVLDRLSARETTRRELERQAQSLIAVLDETALFRTPSAPTAAARQTELRRIINRIKGLSNLSEEDIGILVGTTLENLDGTTPRNITLDADDRAQLATPNSIVSGNRGRVVYAAAIGDTRVLKYVVVVARPHEATARRTGHHAFDRVGRLVGASTRAEYQRRRRGRGLVALHQLDGRATRTGTRSRAPVPDVDHS
jgi:hypothetical protein